MLGIAICFCSLTFCSGEEKEKALTDQDGFGVLGSE